jgi:alpha-glucosidase
MRRFACVLLLLAAAPAAAQDECRLSSPDGQLEFILGIAQPQGGGLTRLGYQVLYKGQPLIALSYLGLDIRDQEPLLGENLGLIGSHKSKTPAYSALTAEYMQNGSLGRRVNVEVRTTNDGIAFRYALPRSTPLEKILVDNEVTEFDLAKGTQAKSPMQLPVIVEQPGIGWISIDEFTAPPFPPATLARTQEGVLMIRLPSEDHFHPAVAATPPLITPWRVITIAPTREGLTQSQILRALKP